MGVWGVLLAMRTEHHKKQIKTLADCKKLAMEPPTFIQTVFGAGLGEALATTEEREASLHADQLVCACEAAFSDAPPSVVPPME